MSFFYKPLLIMIGLSCLLGSPQLRGQNTHRAEFSKAASQYLSTPDSDSLRLGGDFTLEAWIKPVTVSANDASTILAKYDGAAAAQWRSYSFNLVSNGKPALSMSTDGTYSTAVSVEASNPVLLNSWQHVAVVKSGTSVTHYLNGVLNGTGTLSGAPYASPASFTIGAEGTLAPQRYFDGSIDEVRVWSIARTQAQIQASMSSELGSIETGMRGYWKMNNSLVDSTGNGNTLANSAGVTFQSTDLPFVAFTGPNTHRAQFVRTQSQYLTAADSASLNFGNGGLTVEAWVKADADSANLLGYTMVFKTFPGDDAYGIALENGGYLYGRVGGAHVSNEPFGHADNVYSSSQLDDGLWHHVAFSYDQVTLRIYVDGSLVADRVVPGQNASCVGPLTIGGFPLEFYSGSIDEVRIWSGARTQPQIQAAMFLELAGTESGLRAYWKMNNSLVDSTGNGNALSNTSGVTFHTTDLPFPLEGSAGLLSHYLFDDDTVNDSSGNANHGVIHGTPQFLAGAVGKGIKLNGSTDWVEIGPDTVLTRYTLAAWVRLDGPHAGDDMTILGDGGTREAYFLGIRNNGKFRAATGGGSIYSTTLPSIGQFYHVAFTREADGTARLYVNGVLESSGNLIMSGSGYTVAELGALRNGTIDRFNGVIDDARIYERALSQAEILQLLSYYRITGSANAAGPVRAPVVAIANGGSFTRTATANVFGSYELANVPSGVSYALSAFLDINRNGQQDGWEPQVVYANNPVVVNGNVAGVNMTITQSPADSDGDGIADGWETEFGLVVGSDDSAADNDGDGLRNQMEYLIGSKPNQADSDQDTIGDLAEYLAGGDVRSTDADGDALPDQWEVANGLNPLANDANADPDGDGLTNVQEYNGGTGSTNPRNRDTDADGVSDYEERFGIKFVAHHYDRLDRLVSTAYDNGAWEGWRYDGNGNILRHLLRTVRDADNDGLPDAWELAQGLSFGSGSGSQGFSGDLDGDGWTNYQEYLADSQANDPLSLPPSAVASPIWLNPPKSRIIFPPASGGGLARVYIKIWDPEGTNVQGSLQWWDVTTQQWKPATLLKVNNGPPAGAEALATSPGGIQHELVWNAFADVPTLAGNVLLRTTAQDSTGTTISESVTFALSVAADFDGDALPDSFELANGLDAMSALGDDGTNGNRDHDALGNFLEFGFARNPIVHDAANDPSYSVEVNPADNKHYLQLTYRRRLDAATQGLTYGVETSEDLVDWNASGGDVEPVSNAPTGDGVSEAVTVRILPALDGLSSRKFAKVRVTRS